MTRGEFFNVLVCHDLIPSGRRILKIRCYDQNSHFPSITFLYISNVFSAVRCHENASARIFPLATRFSRKTESVVTLIIAATVSSTSRGLTITAASPAISGIDPLCEVITGVPHVIASRTGKPNPSYKDG